MYWLRNRTTVPRILLAATLAMTTAAAPTKVLIVRSAGPSAKSYPPGRSLPENARITLAMGDTLTLLGSAGTLTLRGPGKFAATVQVRPGPRTVPPGMRAVTAAMRGKPNPHSVSPVLAHALTVW